MVVIGPTSCGPQAMMQSATVKADAIDAVYARGERAGIPPDLVRAFVHDLLADVIERLHAVVPAHAGITLRA